MPENGFVDGLDAVVVENFPLGNALRPIDFVPVVVGMPVAIVVSVVVVVTACGLVVLARMPVAIFVVVVSGVVSGTSGGFS